LPGASRAPSCPTAYICRLACLYRAGWFRKYIINTEATPSTPTSLVTWLLSTPCNGVRVARSWRSGNFRTVTVSVHLMLPHSGLTKSDCMLNVDLIMWYGVQGGGKNHLYNRCIGISAICTSRSASAGAALSVPQSILPPGRTLGSGGFEDQARAMSPSASSQSMHAGASYAQAFVQSALRTRTATRGRPRAADLGPFLRLSPSP
jgi:hypothetical protein